MGAMKDYALWLEENGYTEWDEIKEEFYYTSSEDPDELFKMYREDREKTRERLYTKPGVIDMTNKDDDEQIKNHN